MVAKALELFSAYRSDKIPPRNGYIIFSYLIETNEFVCYEIVSYWAIRSLCLTQDGLTFFAQGRRTFIYVESQQHQNLTTEAIQSKHRALSPLTDDALLLLEVGGSPKILINQIPLVVDASFCVSKTEGTDFAFLILPHEEVINTICSFLTQTLEEESLCSRTSIDDVVERLKCQLDKPKLQRDH